LGVFRVFLGEAVNQNHFAAIQKKENPACRIKQTGANLENSISQMLNQWPFLFFSELNGFNVLADQLHLAFGVFLDPVPHRLRTATGSLEKSNLPWQVL
jgi:hypothetical protein